MCPIGPECALALEMEGSSVALPFVEETLRPLPVVERREPLLGRGYAEYLKARGGGSTGCVLTRLGPDALPSLLRVCFGEAEESEHVPGTHGMFASDFRLADRYDGFPSFNLVVDRVVERLRYAGLKARGFELRAKVEEALYLRLDVSGGEPVPTTDAMPELLGEEHFAFESGAVLVDGTEMTEVYELAATVETGLQWYARGRGRNGAKRVTFAMHAPLDETVARVASGGSHTVELRFALCSTFPEPWRTPELTLCCEDMVLRREQKDADSPGELCSPYLFFGRGEVTARLVRAEVLV